MPTTAINPVIMSIHFLRLVMTAIPIDVFELTCNRKAANSVPAMLPQIGIIEASTLPESG